MCSDSQRCSHKSSVELMSTCSSEERFEILKRGVVSGKHHAHGDIKHLMLSLPGGRSSAANGVFQVALVKDVEYLLEFRGMTTLHPPYHRVGVILKKTPD